MWYFILFVVTLLIDQISKIIVDANNFEITVIDAFLNIDNEYNPGASFSFLAGVSWAQTFFIVLTAVVLIAGIIFVMFVKMDSKWLKVALRFYFRVR